MNIAEFHFSNGNKTQAQIEDSNEKIFKIFLEKRLKNYNQYIKATKDIIKECKRLNIVNRDDFDTFQINSIEVLTNLLFELKNGLLREYDLKSSNRCPHACIKSHYLEFVKYVNAYKNYVSKDMVKYLKTRGGEKEFKVEIKNQKIEIIASINNIRKYSSNRFLEYSVLGKNEVESYAKPLFEDILSNSNLSAIKQSENEKILIENQNIPLNQILYGPPGTGKTYHTIDKALEILGENLENRDEKKAKFDEYVKNGQIVFTTFHQSYGYEEFVEGIKPRIDSKENSKEVEYEIKDGIFKELCKKALDNYKVSLLTQEEFVKSEDLENKIEIFLDELVDQQKFIEKIQSGGFKLEEYNEKYRIITDDTNANLYLNLEIFKTLLENKDKIINGRSIKQILNNKHRRQIDSYYFQLVKLFKEREQDYKVDNNPSEKPELKPYIIIIDEINRGNVSKIFGELITLIEPSKRIGEKEELKVTLPYSGEKFGVPKNVYIIGTMNTADRSITSLDTALRRRFEFIEMMPDVSKLSMDCEGINLQELLKAINTRIEYLLDREKTIGHAFFVSVENLEDLKKVFQNKIIPLLQEYFYNDYALINEVLNDNGMIFEDKKDDKYLQKIKNLDSVNSERSIYNIASFDDKIWDKIEIYQAIYNDEIANKLKNENE
ncbi:AAA family ATPase [Campylobacter jejuni]|uniref:McrB family protein n=1 Tax=Campylobacter TaxID=194 RepID=UPI0001C49901|nr:MULTISPECIES: AAA family ATPase [Campylobacter]EAH6106743.1 AAA family ATPase [Campylobacter coli]ADC27784.1 McrBC restriction endonuclease system, McrB subunit, putative [Campylobacter jejuni subsp. jejuni IA3902]ADT71908.1 McrBC restriction endonuclease system, McrB subunit, putative [Campylobacter jejuni subsp. jejuni S3]AHK77657.1 ATPase AAA [Campylobacter coli RM4661]AHW91096.1 McrBC restriction endonuclease system, McrB subunit, putative [Campylobacter jejuni subsp. jejuni R14]